MKQKDKFKIKLNRKARIRATTLELSKLLMHDFHYKYHYNCHNKTELLLADTDSLMCEIEIENVYADFYKNKELFDFTIYLKESNCYVKSNTLVVRKMKDKLCDMLIKKPCRIKSKNVYLYNRKWSWM